MRSWKCYIEIAQKKYNKLFSIIIISSSSSSI